MKTRTAAQLWTLMGRIQARAIRHDKAIRSAHGISFKGPYRTLMNRAAVEFDRKPIADRLPIYNSR